MTSVGAKICTGIASASVVRVPYVVGVAGGLMSGQKQHQQLVPLLDLMQQPYLWNGTNMVHQESKNQFFQLLANNN